LKTWEDRQPVEHMQTVHEFHSLYKFIRWLNASASILHSQLKRRQFSKQLAIV